MAHSPSIRPEQIQRAKELLQALPKKEVRKTRREATKILEKDFENALKKGYDAKELCTLLKNEGIIIPAYLIEECCSGEKERSSRKIEGCTAGKEAI